VFEIGASLREARLRQNLDIRDAEAGTKIRTKYLKALEDEQFDLLPAQTYVRGFLRAYAEYLGLDGQLYVDEWNSRYVVDDDGHGHAQIRSRRVETRARRQRKREGNFAAWAVGAIVVVTALVIAAWRFGGNDTTSETIPGLEKAQPSPTVTTTRPAAPALLLVRASRGNSWVEAHAGSQAGKLLYQGTLERGQQQAFRSKRVWITIGIPRNVTIRVNGEQVKLLERRKPTAYVVTATGLEPA
jgi:cytoskeleton protein RodZ